MKAQITIGVIFVICASGVSAQQNLLDMARDACKSKTSVDAAVLSKARGGDLTVQNPALKEYVKCLYFTLGIIDDQGNLKIDELVKMEPDESEKKKLISAIDVCKKVTGTDDNDKAWNIMKCFHDQYPFEEIDI